MALTQENIDLIAQTVRTADSDAQRSVQGTDVTPLIDGNSIWATDRRTPFRWSPTDVNAAIAYQIVKPDSGLAGSWLLAGGAGLNSVDVYSVADFPAPVAGVITLAASTRYLVHGHVDIGTNVITASAGSGLEGVAGAQLINTNTVPLVTCGSFAFTCNNIALLNLGGPCIVWSGDGGGDQLTLRDSIFSGVTSAVWIHGHAGDYICIRDCDFWGTTSGLQVHDVWDSIVINACRFLGAGDQLMLTSAAGEIEGITVVGCEFKVANGSTGVTQNTVDAVDAGRLVGNMFTGAGTFIDANVATTEWVGTSNVGVADF
jgi:hypothetical protein